MNNFNKVVAGLSALAIIAASTLTTNAAALADVTATYNTGDDTVTVATTTTVDFAVDTVATLVIADNAGNSVVDTSDSVLDTSTTDTFIITDAELAGLAAGEYTVSVVTTGGEFGSAVFYKGGANQVNVSANVVPVLAMDVTNTDVSFGDMVADQVATGNNTTAITVDTNAVSGYVLSVQNVGLYEDKDSSGTLNAGDLVITAVDSIEEDLSQAGNYGYGINASVDNLNDTDIDGRVSADGTVHADYDGAADAVSALTTSAKELVRSNGAVANQTTTVTYKAKVSALQEAGNYSDVITYTITASF